MSLVSGSIPALVSTVPPRSFFRTRAGIRNRLLSSFVRSLSLRERLGREREVHHQCAEVGPVAERVEGRFGPESVVVAVAHADGLPRQAHRQIGLGRPFGGRYLRAVEPGQARERRVATRRLEPLMGRPRRQPFVQSQRPPGVGRGAGVVAQSAAGLSTLVQRVSHVAAV